MDITNDFKKWLQAEEIEQKENGVYIKFGKIDFAHFEFLCEEYAGEALTTSELIMPNEEFEILIEVYKSSNIKWN